MDNCGTIKRMGIKGLSQLLRKKVINYEIPVSMHRFANQIVVIDAPVFIYSFKAIRKLDESIVLLLITLLEHKIKPLFVFDGLSPKEKQKELEKRSQRKRQLWERVEKLEKDFMDYKQYDVLSEDLKQINRDVHHKKNLLTDETSYIAIDLIKQVIDSRKLQCVKLTEQDFTSVKTWLTYFGVPYISAKNEAEMTCAFLVRQNFAKAVLTKDTDALACLTPIMLSNVQISKKTFTMINLTNILNELGMSKESWLDFCIMCGTDFNDTLPQVGTITSLGLIQQYKSLEEIEAANPDLDMTPLRYKETRQLFQSDETFDPMTLKWQKIDWNKVNNYAKKLGLSHLPFHLAM